MLSRDRPVIFISITKRRLKKDAHVSITLWLTIRMLIVWTKNTCLSATIAKAVIVYLRRRRRYTFLPVFVRLYVCQFVCQSVCEQDYFKKRAWIWIKCCVSTDVGTWTNWLTFEHDPDYSPDAGTGLLSPIKYALQRGILLRQENPRYAYWRGRSLQQGVVLKWFYSPRAVGTPLSEVRALSREPSSFLCLCLCASTNQNVVLQTCPVVRTT